MNNESNLIQEDKLWGKIIEKKKIGLVSCTQDAKLAKPAVVLVKVNSDGECVIKGGVDYA